MAVIQRVSFDSIATLSLSLADASEGIQQTLDRMDGSLAPLRAEFTGEAAEAYQVAKAKWTSQMVEMTDFLASISRAAASAGKALSAAEASIVKSL